MAIILNIDELKALCDEIEYEKRSERPGQDFFFYDLFVFQAGAGLNFNINGLETDKTPYMFYTLYF